MATMPIAPPAFDLTTLALSMYFKAGATNDVRYYAAPAGLTGAGYTLWQGTASAGASGNYDVYRGVAENHLGVILDGYQTLRIRNADGAGVGACVGTANLRSGAAVPVPTQFNNSVTEGVQDPVAGTIFCLVNLDAINGGHRSILGSYASILTNATGPVVEFGDNAPDAYVTRSAPSLSTWAVMFFRWGSNLWEARINKGAWGTLVRGNCNAHTAWKFGTNIYGSADADIANAGQALTKFNDLTCDNIYDGLKSMYPSAGLP
jgi:hypothetical protein